MLKSIFGVLDKRLFSAIRQRQFSDGLSPFFYSALRFHSRYVRSGPPVGNYYEFGVGWGETLTAYIKALKKFCEISKKDIYSYHIVGFDSFEGLPEKESAKDDHIEWHAKLFETSLAEIERKVIKQGIDLKRGNVRFVKGFFEKTLTPALRDRLAKWVPSIVTIDVDYYSSTKTVLDWLRPILVSGTLFYFDDVWSFHGNPNYGELAAINEFNEAGEGLLTPYPCLGLIGNVFIYSRKEFEFKSKS